MTLLVIFPYRYRYDELAHDTPYDVAPVHIVLRHERIEDVFLASEHPGQGRFRVVGKARDCQKRQKNDDLEELTVGQLAVCPLNTSEVVV